MSLLGPETFAPANDHLRPRTTTWLDSLPAGEADRARSVFRFARLPAESMVSSPARPSRDVVFVLEGVLTLVCELEDGFGAGVALLGPGACLGWLESAARVEQLGTAYALTDVAIARAPYASLIEAVGYSSRLARLGLESATDLSRQGQIAAACTARHTIRQRLARWLLEIHALSHLNDLRITQACAARSLGAQRTSVTKAAGELEETGAIRIGRGRVRVLNVAKLEQSSCSCQGSLDGTYGRA